MTDYLQHYGVKGMKWGVRKDRSGSRTSRMAKRDAKRYVDAKMFYGKTAGTKRKLLNAELNKKKKTIDGYEKAFDEAVKRVDEAKAAKKAVRKRTAADVTYRARVTTKQFLSVTGPLTIAAAGMLYRANKEQVDAFVSSQIDKLRYRTVK